MSQMYEVRPGLTVTVQEQQILKPEIDHMAGEVFDLSREAGQVFGLNERLSQLLQHVAALEAANKDLQIRNDQLMKAIGDLERLLKEYKDIGSPADLRKLNNHAVGAQKLIQQLKDKIKAPDREVSEMSS